MMLSKKNSEALENFSEKLEVEGRSLWQDARRRFMHNRAAAAEPGGAGVDRAVRNPGADAVAVLPTDDTDWANDVQRPGYRVRSLLSVPTPPAATCWCALPSAGESRSWSALPPRWWRCSLGTLVRLAVRLSRRESRFGNDASAGDPQLLPVHVLRHPAGDLLSVKTSC